MNDYKKYGEYSSAESSIAETAGNAIVFLVIGAGIGALLSLFLTPKTGEELRRSFRDKFDDAVKGLNDQTSRLRRRTTGMAGEAREKVSPIRNTR